MTRDALSSKEFERLQDEAQRVPNANWKRWGPYLPERQWGTVREDYWPDSKSWYAFPHDHARMRAYRWGEDGLMGLTDRQCRLCFAIALWNGKDSILKERLFGLGNPEGNHGEDVKECYFYLDGTPTHSYMKAMYKYPQQAFPYDDLRVTNQQRSRKQLEYELLDTGIFDDDRYFDVMIEYAKAAPEDLLIRITITNRASLGATLHLLPTLWFRNTWAWPGGYEKNVPKPSIQLRSPGELLARHKTLGEYYFAADVVSSGKSPPFLFTENETDTLRLSNPPAYSPGCKDAFHLYLTERIKDALNPEPHGTKAAAHYRFRIGAGASRTVRLRLVRTGSETSDVPFGPDFDRIFEERIAEADAFHESNVDPGLTVDEKRIRRQAIAGLLWTKQFYYYVVKDWRDGDDRAQPLQRTHPRNKDWRHLFNRDILSVPDKWEYPWYAAWDSAFHMVPFANVDPAFAKEQLILFLREWYMHPNGQIPAYEWNLGDVNPPVHAWACWRVYQLSAPPGHRDRLFLSRCFQKLLLNFTWWVNRKDVRGQHVFTGGFLGLDNIGIFDRSKPLPTGGHLEQADGTAWMAYYCSSMLSIAFELAAQNPAYEDVASKFFEHYVAIAEAMNSLDGTGLWDEEDGFYYDHLHTNGHGIPLKIRSLVGIIPLLTVDVLHEEVLRTLPGFLKRTDWFLNHRKDLHNFMTYMERNDPVKGEEDLRLLALPTRDRLERILKYVLDEDEFLSPFGIRSLSKYHEKHPFVFHLNGEHRVEYVPGESDSWMFGGNSNWRGPVWFPVNYLLIEAFERYHQFYGDTLKVECPTGSGVLMNLGEVADEIRKRLVRLFLKDDAGNRPSYTRGKRLMNDPHWRDLVLFYEYFHADTGRGLGASHQTGWTALVVPILEQLARKRRGGHRVSDDEY